MQERAMTHQCRHLVTPSKSQQTIERIDVQLERLQRWAPRYGGRQMYFRDLCRALVPAGVGDGPSNKRKATQVMEAHARMYEELSVEDKAGYDIYAGDMNREVVVIRAWLRCSINESCGQAYGELHE